MNISGFSEESLQEVKQLLYAEQWENPYEGQCGQKKLREQNKGPRTPAQEQADQARAQALRGRSASGANRSEAAKKAAETRRQCKGQPAKPDSSPK